MAPSILDRVLRRASPPSADAVEGPLPTFITIGTMKGGTSALHSYLSEHPQVGMSKPKETNFFCSPDHDGHDLAWYRGLFSGSGPQFGESSPNYTKRHLFDGVVERMKPVLPDIRLIFLARDPIDRAVSHFLHNVAKGRVRRDDFSTYFDDLDNPAILTSRYDHQLEPFVEAYGLDRIFVMASEDLRDDRAAALKRVFTFLGIDPEFTSPKFTIDRHVTSTKMEKAGESLDRPALTGRQREAIADHLRPDIDRFRALVGHDFAQWSI
ncbi:MAG: sulfotransferase family protein [Aeromicrobium sp.]